MLTARLVTLMEPEDRKDLFDMCEELKGQEGIGDTPSDFVRSRLMPVVNAWRAAKRG